MIESEELHGVSKPWVARLPAPMLFFRTVGAFAIAVMACLLPEVGSHRFLLAGTLVFFCIPAALWLESNYPVAENGWSEPLFDLGMVVTLVHLVPNMWFTALVIGLMVVQAPSIADNRKSFVFYGWFATILTVGMTFAAVVHGVEGWEIPILAMVALYPSVIFYAHWQANRQNLVRDRAAALEGLHLVAGGVAHDFNNLLTAVVGHTEVAKAELPDSHPVQAALSEVMDGASRAGLLSAHLLAFSGRHLRSDELLDLEAELIDLIQLMQPVVPTGITLRMTSRLEGERVKCDRSQLHQVVMNLILNGCEATKKLPSSVSLSLTLHDGSRLGQQWVQLSVVDRGVGIPKEEQDKIFDPFYTSKEKGHGLGLVSARKIIEEIDGSIDVESDPGVGTEVLIRFPAHAKATVVEPAPTSKEGQSMRQRHALVVDDEPAVRSTIAQLLGRLDFSVDEAESAEKAVELFSERPAEFDLAMVDLKMPGHDGWQCFDALREARRDVPVIVCSGYDPAELQERPEDARMTFLAKPFRLAALRDAVGRVAPGEQVRP